MYLKGNLYTKRYLSTDNLSNIIGWVDMSFGVHLGLAGTYRNNDVYGERHHREHCEKTQDECGEFNGIGTGKYRQCPGYDYMVQILHGSAGVYNQEQSPVPR